MDINLSIEQSEAAAQRLDAQRERYSTVVAVDYHAKLDRLVIELSNGLQLSFAPKLAQVLRHATAHNLAEVEISDAGLALYFPRIDASLYIPGLLAGMLGTREWMRSEFAKQGGQTTSPAKAAAARANGKLGGRPRKNKAVA